MVLKLERLKSFISGLILPQSNVLNVASKGQKFRQLTTAQTCLSRCYLQGFLTPSLRAKRGNLGYPGLPRNLWISRNDDGEKTESHFLRSLHINFSCYTFLFWNSNR